MLEVTGADIAALDDADLRTLVGLLCEAELRRRGLTTAAVTAGGDQNAPDGGVDVRVALPPGAAIDGFIPRPDTVFQSKKSDLARSAIRQEMRPGGLLRPVLVELATAGGAYVIVSAGARVSDTALRDREAAMRAALDGDPAEVGLTLGYYDGARIATWLRDHPGWIPWVRARIGRSLHGWQSHGPWSRQPAGVEAGYLLDDAARVRTGVGDADGLSAADGIDRIREALRDPGRAVRLIGLSGVGKTRLAEALFDPAVGHNSLDPSLAIYTDIADEPDPQPGGLAADLIAKRTRAILVVDNCPPETHRRLADIATAADSTLGLLTIEYDIQDGEPEETAVFALDTSSPEVIARLVGLRHPALSEVDLRTIAAFSGGNARIALALAGTGPRRGSFAGLGDRELFRRLFVQRNDPDASLLTIAQACALLYSFEGETLDGEAAELPILGGLIGRSADAVHAAAAELMRRQLMQARGPWRAVLPHVIANGLAVAALEEIPRPRLLAALVDGASDRVRRSFSRRLGYLDENAEAQAIVRSWLAPGGLLADIARLDELGVAMLTNVAPVAPEAALAALEAAVLGADDGGLERFTPFIGLMRALAYDTTQFERAAALLVKMARLPREERRIGHASEVLESLFHITLSGTEAPLEVRLPTASRLLHSDDAAEAELGTRLLRAALTTGPFSSSHGFEFGARSRGYGLHPRTGQDVRDWYAAVLDLAIPFAPADGAAAGAVRDAIADAFWGLWVQGEQASALTRFVHAVVGARGFWCEGWATVRRLRTYGAANLSPEALAELTVLEGALGPRSLIDRVRGGVLGSNGRGLDFDDCDEADDALTALDRQRATAERLARETMADDTAFSTLLPELVAGGGYSLCVFAETLALAAKAPRAIWAALVSQAVAIPQPRLTVPCCFLSGLWRRDPGLAQTLLVETSDDPVLAPYFPVLQASVPIDDAALARLHRALDLGAAPIDRFSGLANGGACDAIAEPELRRLLARIAEADGGAAVARDILRMRLHADREGRRETGPELRDAGRALLAPLRFARGAKQRHNEDYELAQIARTALAGEAGRADARSLSRRMAVAIARYEIGPYEYDELIRALLETQPDAALDGLFSGSASARARVAQTLRDLPRPGRLPLSMIPDDILIAWCERAPAERYPVVASAALLFARADDKAPLAWTDLAQRLLGSAPDPVTVFAAIVDQIHPTSWSGSLASKLASRLDLLNRLDITTLPILAEPMAAARATLRDRIERERRREQAEDSERNSRFE